MATRQSTTPYVILGVLNSGGALSGYEIQRWIADTIGFFWTESFGQIYPELRRLEGEGLIARSRADGSGARARQRFRITAAGRKALRQWLEKPAAPEHRRIEYLLKLMFGRESSARANRAHIESVARAHAELRHLFATFRAALEKEDAESPDLVYWLIALRHGQWMSRARSGWAEEALSLLDAAERGGNRAVLALLRRIEKEGKP
jgi:DNA-binding PadR family transcriptional regulator